MNLRQLMARHARTVLVRKDHHGEDVLYQFKDGTPDRTITAVVNRQDIAPAQPGSVLEIGQRTAIVWIPRHETAGVLAIAPGDRLELALRLGDEAVSARIRRVVSQDEAGFEVEVAG